MRTLWECQCDTILDNSRRRKTLVRQITDGESEGVPLFIGGSPMAHDGERVVKHSFFILVAEMLDKGALNLVGWWCK